MFLFHAYEHFAASDLHLSTEVQQRYNINWLKCEKNTCFLSSLLAERDLAIIASILLKMLIERLTDVFNKLFSRIWTLRLD